MIRAFRLPRRSVLGSACALAVLAALSLLLLAVHAHIDIATVGLVLVVPVVVGTVVGGMASGSVAAIGGFLAYDLLFIKPYYTFAVGRAENWVPLGVYVIVMALTARVTSHLWSAEAEGTRRRELDTERLFELSELLIQDRPMPELLRIIVGTVSEAFEVEGVVLLLPTDNRLEVVAEAGRGFSPDELRRIRPEPGVRVSLIGDDDPDRARSGQLRTMALSSGARPVGLLGLAGLQMQPNAERLLATFGHHLAVAIERAQLREQTVRIGVLEEVDVLRRSLVGAVSHDLRTPLSTIKAAASSLRNTVRPVAGPERDELVQLIENQTDRLTRLVTNLLDMSRIQSHSLVVSPETVPVATFLEGGVAALGPEGASRVVMEVEADLPPVSMDPVLMTEVLVNLLENALRYSPPETPVRVEAFGERADRAIVVCVSDNGPGVARADRADIFERSRRVGATGVGEVSGGAGIGLSIAKAFTEAHGTSIWLESPPDGGARFCFSIWAADEPSIEPPAVEPLEQARELR